MAQELTSGERWSRVEPHRDVYEELYAIKNLLEGEWALAVVCALARGPKHNGEILDKIQEYHVADKWSSGHTFLHPGSLTRFLGRLTKDELLLREEKPRSFPRSVRYSLSEPAVSLLAATGPLVDWVDEHAALIAQAQQWRRG